MSVNSVPSSLIWNIQALLVGVHFVIVCKCYLSGIMHKKNEHLGGVKLKHNK